MSNPLTPERIQEIARQFDTTPDEVMREWQNVKSHGTAALDVMSKELDDMERTIDEVVATVGVLPNERHGVMATLYHDMMNAPNTDKIKAPDLMLQMAIMLYKLAEAHDEIERLRSGNITFVDGSHRAGRPE